MNISELENIFQSNSINVIEGGKTSLDTYALIPKNRLDSSANRLNSTWIRAEFIILNEKRNNAELVEDINKWRQLNIHKDQFFIVESIQDGWQIFNSDGTLLGGEDFLISKVGSKSIKDVDFNESNMTPYLRAMRTKPFLLLAGISGTGKSRIVKEMAFDSCPKNTELGKDPTSPGNYCLVEVKPNWHDSTELLGYESKINGPEYVATPFVKFLAKAMLYEETPFFVCLDEMNLAPVEQYFAEFLSVLESRKRVGDTITSEPLIKASVFKDYEDKLKKALFDIETETKSYDGSSTDDEAAHYGKENEVYDVLKKKGLRIPPNVIVIGTVNMDETTHQFSRKVIDRAMTIEMNLPEGDPFKRFYDSRELGYLPQHTDAKLYLPTKVSASEALEELAKADAGETETLKNQIAEVLTNLNAKLEGTPFKIAYRVQNELLIYFYEVWQEKEEKDWGVILNDAVDQILMMKVLPRIEGDDTLLTKLLDKDKGTLKEFVKKYPNARKKVEEMSDRLLKSQFTSFWP